MHAVELLIAWQYPDTSVAIVVALALGFALLTPYLLKEIRRGKVDLGPRIPDVPEIRIRDAVAIRRRGNPTANPIRTI